MDRAKSRGRRVKGDEYGSSMLHNLKFCALCSMPYALCSMPYALCSLLYALCPMLFALCFSLFFCGCSAVVPPDDYYRHVLEMEDYGKQVRNDTGRSVGEVVTPDRDSESENIAKTSLEQLPEDQKAQVAKAQLLEETPIEQLEGQSAEGQSALDVQKPMSSAAEIHKEAEQPPQREAIPGTLIPKPIAVASDVIKIALNTANLGISVRNLELVNGRLSGGKNSVRINFLSESVDVVDNKFVAICAVIYHLDRLTKTIDVVIGMAEDKQANLLAVLQSDMSDIAAWMNNEIAPGEWRSRIIKKVL